MLVQLDSPSKTGPGPAFLRAGFRPFFLLAGLQAMLVVPAWLAQALTGLDLKLSYAPSLWHGHEMVFGFASAAVAGFLLTAVPNWTGVTPFKGRPLLVLVLLWLAARLAFWAGGALPPGLGAALDVLFFPALALTLARPLIGAGKWRNIAFLPILGVLTLADALVLAEMVGWASTGSTGLLLAIFVFVLMITIVGGRIIPGFTANGLRLKGIFVQPKARPQLDKAVIASLVIAELAQLTLPGTAVAGALMFLAAALQLARLSGWHGWRTASVPLLWVLHLGYLWLPIGLALFGLSDLVSDLPPPVAIHALTAGCIGMMVLGVMTRAALGHSGRPLVPAPLTVAAYVLVLAAATVRVFGVLVEPLPALWISGMLWTVGFLLYVVVYTPVCLLPRVDGGQN